jgi:hypothetical protein
MKPAIKRIHPTVSQWWSDLNLLDPVDKKQFDGLTTLADSIANMVYSVNTQAGDAFLEALEEIDDWYNKVCSKVPEVSETNRTPTEQYKRDRAFRLIRQDYKRKLLEKYREIFKNWDII